MQTLSGISQSFSSLKGILFGGVAVGQVHLGDDRAGDGEVHVHVRLGGHVLEVDGGEVFVLGLGQVEGELVVDGQVVETARVDGVAEVVVLGVALFAVVARDALGRAETGASPVDERDGGDGEDGDKGHEDDDDKGDDDDDKGDDDDDKGDDDDDDDDKGDDDDDKGDEDDDDKGDDDDDKGDDDDDDKGNDNDDKGDEDDDDKGDDDDDKGNEDDDDKDDDDGDKGDDDDD